jgi:hypothetical protein
MNVYPESGIMIHPSEEMHRFSFKEFFPDFGTTF